MKTTIMKTMKKRLLQALLLVASIGMFNAASACTASFTYTTGANGQITLTSTSTGAIFPTYAWNPGDGSGYHHWSPSTFNYQYLANGTYTVALALNADSSSCIDTAYQVITISNVTVPCTLNAYYTYSIGANGQVKFTSTSSGTNAGTLYLWNFGDGGPTTQYLDTVTHKYTFDGNYLITLTVEDTGAAYCTSSFSMYIDVSTADSNRCGLVANFSYTTGLNGHVNFTNTSTGSYSMLWSNWNPGDGSGNTMTTSSTYSHVYLANGTYNVTLGDTADSAFCHSTITIPVTISNVTIPCTMVASFTATNDSAKGLVHFISTSTDTVTGTQYYWTPGDGSPTVSGTSKFNYTYTSNGAFNAKLSITNTGSGYCYDSTYQIVNVANVDSLHASFIDSASYDSLSVHRYWFSSTSTGVNNNTVYAWEPGDTTAGDTGVMMTSYTHMYTYSGIHTVTLSIWFDKYPIMPHHNFDGRLHGAMYDFSSYSMKIDIGVTGINSLSESNSTLNLYPNPNNGEFRLALSGLTGNNNAEVQITNLLGEVIYTTTMPVNGGTINRDVNLQNVSNGTYFVRIITAGKVFNTKTIINR